MCVSLRSISSTARLVHWISLLTRFDFDLMVHIFLVLFYFLILYFIWLNFQKFITLLFFIQKLWKNSQKYFELFLISWIFFSHFYFDIWYFMYFLNYLLSFNYFKNNFWHFLILKKFINIILHIFDFLKILWNFILRFTIFDLFSICLSNFK